MNMLNLLRFQKKNTAAIHDDGDLEKSKPINSLAEKLSALSGEKDFYFKATVGFDQQSILVGGGAKQNKRDHLEDRLDVARVTGVDQLNDNELYDVARQVTAQLQQQCVDATKNEGSTYTNITVDLANQRIVTTQLGDSEAWFAYEDRDGKTHVVQLHSCLHQLENNNELTRLIRAGHPPVEQIIKNVNGEEKKYYRMGGALLLTRALGDNAFEEHGLLHRPSINIYSYAHLVGAKNFRVIVRSDGFAAAKNKKADEVLIETLNRPENNIQSDLLAKQLLEKQINGDNTSLLIAALPNSKIVTTPGIATDTALSLSIFDGHGSGDVADKAAKKHFSIQQKCINDLLKLKKPWYKTQEIMHTALDAANREKPKLKRAPGFAAIWVDDGEPNPTTSSTTDNPNKRPKHQ